MREDSVELEKVAEHALEEVVVQPSGIWALADDSWMIITDQAEMFAMNANFKVTEKVNIEFDSINCNQSCTEAIVDGDSVKQREAFLNMMPKMFNTIKVMCMYYQKNLLN